PSAAGPTRIRVMAYGSNGFAESDAASISRVNECLQQHEVTWVCVEGLGDAGLLNQLGGLFGLHTLSLEDVASLRSRPKVEFYDDHIFTVARQIVHRDCIHSEQVNIFWGKGFVLTMHKSASDLFDPLRARIRAGKGRHWTRG